MEKNVYGPGIKAENKQLIFLKSIFDNLLH